MKLTLLLLLLPTALYAQDSTRSSLEFGPVILAGASSLFGSLPFTMEHAPRPASTLGVIAVMTMDDDDFSIVSSLTFDARSISMKTDLDPTWNHTINMTYVGLQMGAKWKALTALMSMALPLAIDQQVNPDSTIHTTEQHPDPIIVGSGSQMKAGDLLIELRLGGLLPILTDGNNHLDFCFQATFGVFRINGENSFYTLAADPDHKVNGQMASVQAGLCYFFSLR